jgi:hypothetical protein
MIVLVLAEELRSRSPMCRISLVGGEGARVGLRSRSLMCRTSFLVGDHHREVEARHSQSHTYRR